MAKLLLIALDIRCSDGERLAAVNALARAADPDALAGLLATAAGPNPVEQPFMLGAQQQTEMFEALLLEKDQQLTAARAELERLRAKRRGRIEDGIDLKAVTEMTGLSRATLYRRMAASAFPLACSSAGKAKLWSKSEVSDWIQSTQSH